MAICEREIGNGQAGIVVSHHRADDELEINDGNGRNSEKSESAPPVGSAMRTFSPIGINGPRGGPYIRGKPPFRSNDRGERSETKERLCRACVNDRKIKLDQYNPQTAQQ